MKNYIFLAASGVGCGVLAVALSAMATRAGYPMDAFDVVALMALSVAVEREMR